jgi:hypothetical protein
MKKLTKMLMVLGLASLVTFTACKKDEEEAAAAKITMTVRQVKGATATVIQSGATVDLGDSLNFDIKFEGNDGNKLKSYVITASFESTPLEQGNLSGTSGSVTTGGILDPSDFEPGKSYTITVSLTSDKGTVVSSFTFNTSGNAGPAYTIQSGSINLGNQADADPKFFSAKRNQTFFLIDAKDKADVQADIDFGYATRAAGGGGNKLIAPNSQDATDIYSTQWAATGERITTWTKRNNTYFIATTISQNTFFSAADSTGIDNLIQTARTANEPNNTAVSVQNDKVYLFKTEGGRYGLIYVASATGDVQSGSATAGKADMVVKYQKAN